jgi:RHS repeat-associated protein
VTAVNQYGESDPSNTAQANKPGITGGEEAEDQQGVAADGEGAIDEQAPSDDEGAASERADGGGREVLSGEEEITKYYFLGSQRVAMRQGGDVYYFHTDHLGRKSAMSDGAGDAHGDPVRYLPFGEVHSGDLGSLPTDHGFTGQKHNDDLGLIFMQARFYVPRLGRFASADVIVPNPTDPQSLSRYSYVRNRPLVRIDPSGLCDEGHDGYASCMAIKARLEELYDIFAQGDWWYEEILQVEIAIQAMAQSFSENGADDGRDAARQLFGGTRVKRIRGHHDYANAMKKIGNRIDFYDGTFKGTVINGDQISHPPKSLDQIHWTVVHEFAHVWDSLDRGFISWDLRKEVGGHYEWSGLKRTYAVNDPLPDGRVARNQREDWSDTFAAFVVDRTRLSAVRCQVVTDQINRFFR